MSGSAVRRSGGKARTAAGAGRTLIYIPILHAEADMGSLARSIHHLVVQKLGSQAWQSNVDLIGRMWAHIRGTVESWNLPWQKVRLYEDGLPLCGHERQIVETLADAGSPNHQLLLSLTKRGATLEGTESPQLLVEEYRLARLILGARDPQHAAKIQARYAAQSRRLLVRRDRYIVGRINESLRAGETGILFLGMLHSLPRLAKDIRVSYPIYRPNPPVHRSHA
jgi:hypothetical protein